MPALAAVSDLVALALGFSVPALPAAAHGFVAVASALALSDLVAWVPGLSALEVLALDCPVPVVALDSAAEALVLVPLALDFLVLVHPAVVHDSAAAVLVALPPSAPALLNLVLLVALALDSFVLALLTLDFLSTWDLIRP